jgi:hypothetical protein
MRPISATLLATCALLSLPATASAQAPSQLLWGAKGTLHVAFDDAQLASVSTTKRVIKPQALQRLPARDVLAISPAGDLVLIRAGGAAVELREIKKGEPVMRFEREAAPVAAHFSPDGKVLYVILSDGMIHVWKDTPKLVKIARSMRGVKEDPDDLFVQMRKNKAELSAGLADPVSGPVGLGDAPDLALVQGGQSVTYWNTHTPTEATSVFKASGPIRHIVVQDKIILTLSTDDKLEARRVTDKGPRKLDWVEEAPVLAIATSANMPGHFIAVTADAIALRKLDSGEPVWTVPRLPGPLCGLAADGASQQIALCADGIVALHSLKDGAQTRELRREGAHLVELKRPKLAKKKGGK